MTCSWSNLPSCVGDYAVNALFNFILGILNAPVSMFLEFIKKLLTEPVNIEIFHSTWLIIVYILSFFYVLIFLYAGFKFIASANNPVERENAKDWLKNAFFLVVFVQASFFIYESALMLASSLSAGMMSSVDTSFFSLSIEGSLGLQIMLLIPYLAVLLLTALILGIRYILVSIGIIFFTLGIFAYFVEPIRDIGKFMVGVVLAVLFIPFLQAIMILAISKIVENFAGYKILILICGFLMIDVATIGIVWFVVMKSATSIVKF